MNDMRFTIYVNDATTVLTHSPDGWQDMVTKLERSETYYGMLNEYSVNLKFPKEGAEQIRQAFYTELWYTIPTIKIERLDKFTGQYVEIVTLEFDMATFEDYHTYIQCTCIKGGLARLLKVNGSTEFTVGEITTDRFRFYRPALTTRDVEYYTLSRVAELLFAKLIDGGSYAIDTTLLDDYDATMVLTTGRAIREQSVGDVQLTFEQFFKIINAIKPIGIKIEDVGGTETLIFVDRPDLYDSTTDIDTVELGENFQVKLHQANIARYFELGYDTQDYEDATSIRYEIAVTSKFKVDIPNLTNVMDLKCPIRADVYGMYDIWDTAEGNEDALFLVCVYDDPSSIYLTPEPGTTTDISDPAIAAYNVRISPRRLLQAHKPWIDCMAWPLFGSQCNFVSGGLNIANLTTDLTTELSNVYAEGVGFELEEPTIFKPVLFVIDATVDSDFYDKVKANPYGVVTFAYEGNNYRGFVQNLSYKMYGSKYISVDLLCTFDTDLTKLIR